MANDNDLYDVSLSNTIEIKPATQADFNQEGFNIFINNEEADCADTYSDAIEEALKYLVDDDLTVSGYGTHSGRKFWQLPESIQEEVVKLASNG